MKKILCIFLVLVLGIGTASAIDFPDVRSDASYAEAVSYLSEVGIMIGDEGGRFNPDKEVTRGEMAAIVCRLLGEEDLPITMRFPDVPTDHWANSYIGRTAEMGIVTGYGSGYFGPADAVTYAQAITMVVRAMGLERDAQRAGGYPDGYISTARRNGFLTGVNGSAESALSRADVAVLSYNSLFGKPVACAAHSRGQYYDFEAAHPHHSIYTCAVCGENYADKDTDRYYEKCELCNPTPQAPEFIWPLGDGVGNVSSAAGVSRGGYIHVGTDIAAAAGTPILAIADGVVATAQYNSNRGYYIKIDHGDYYCTYQHMQSEAVVKSGKVTQGQVIGYVGNTGESYGDHLHFEMVKTSSCPPGNKDLYTIVNILKKTPVYYAVTRGSAAGTYYALNLSQVGSGEGSTGSTDEPGPVVDPGSDPVKTDGTYYSIKNKYTGKVLNVYYNRSADGTNVDIYDMDYTDSVYWKFAASGGGYVLSPRNATGSALNVYGDAAKNGSNVCIWTKTGHSTQTWIVEAVSGGYILRSASNKSLVLGATGNSNNSNVNLQTYKAGNNYQIWNFYEE